MSIYLFRAITAKQNYTYYNVHCQTRISADARRWVEDAAAGPLDTHLQKIFTSLCNEDHKPSAKEAAAQRGHVQTCAMGPERGWGWEWMEVMEFMLMTDNKWRTHPSNCHVT